MSTLAWIGAFGIAAGVFLALDLVWLGLVANDFYARQLGELKRPTPLWSAALVFYAMFLAGLLWFCVRPAIADGGSLGTAALNGALFGLVTYATWNLTNAAVVRDFPTRLVPVDMAWGTVLSCVVAVATTLAARRIWL